MTSVLVSTKKYFLAVFETKEAAASVSGPAASGTVDAFRAGSSTAAYWTQHLGVQVWFSMPGDVFLVLEEYPGESLLKVLHGDRVGWLRNDWYCYKLEEVKS